MPESSERRELIIDVSIVFQTKLIAVLRIDRVHGLACLANGQNWPSFDAVVCMPQNWDIGSFPCAATIIAIAWPMASLSTCQRTKRESRQTGMRIEKNSLLFACAKVIETRTCVRSPYRRGWVFVHLLLWESAKVESSTGNYFQRHTVPRHQFLWRLVRPKGTETFLNVPFVCESLQADGHQTVFPMHTISLLIAVANPISEVANEARTPFVFIMTFLPLTFSPFGNVGQTSFQYGAFGAGNGGFQKIASDPLRC